VLPAAERTVVRVDTDTGTPEDELAQLRRERDQLAERVASLETRRSTGPRRRRALVAVLLVIGVATFTASSVGWWARRNLATTDVWVQRVGPLADDPDVRRALGTWLSAEVVDLVDPKALFEEVLPERGQILAVPLSGAVEDFVRARVDRFIASDRFESLWIAANERAHRAVLRVLRGESDVVLAQGNKVVIDLIPVVDALLADIGSASPEIFGREVDLPDLTFDDLPEAAVGRLESALGVQLDDDFGQFTIYDKGRLTALQDGIDQARRWLVIISVTAVVAIVAALWMSDRRRRTLLQLLVGLALGITLIRRLGLRGQRELLDAIPNQTNRAAASAASDRFLEPLLAVTQTLLILLAVGAVLAVLTGPYPWAVRLRSRGSELVRRVDGDWVTGHQRELGIAGLAVVFVILLVVDVSFFGLVVIGALVALGTILLRGGISPRSTA
jgi:hypothetical protein